MSKQMHQTGRIEHAGAIDADGHILEPPISSCSSPRSSSMKRSARSR